MGARRLEDLIAALPPDSAVFRANNDQLAMGWGFSEELLAVVAELVDFNNRMFHEANSKKGTKKLHPIFINRPGSPAPERRKATAEDMARIFGGGRIIHQKEE